MRRVILQQFTTIDGLAADERGETEFVSEYAQQRDESFERDAMEFLDTVDTMILGRKTYQLFAGYWPNVSGDDAEFGRKLNSLKKYVVSSTLKEAPWGKWEPAEIISNDPATRIRALRNQEGKDMVIWGSITLATALLSSGLIDEIQLRMIPIVLGSGRQLFEGDLDSHNLELLGANPYDRGLVLLRFQTKS
jgi:dihydrofolate reductase